MITASRLAIGMPRMKSITQFRRISAPTVLLLATCLARLAGRMFMLAIVLYSLTRGEDAMTPEEVAKDYELPIEMVREAIDYCEKNPDVLRQDVEMEDKSSREYWKTHPPIVPPGFVIPES